MSWRAIFPFWNSFLGFGEALPESALLLEEGDFILLESGDYLMTEEAL